MKRLFFNGLKSLGIILALIVVFYIIFKYLIINNIVVNNTEVTSNSITTYQFYELVIIYISSCLTTLAIIVALLKDEIKYYFKSAKIVIKPKSSQFLIEKYDKSIKVDIKAELYEVILTVVNTGSLHVNSCSISLTDLIYSDRSDHTSLVDVPTGNINWMGIGAPHIHLPSYGGKAEVSVMQIKTNDASTTDSGQSQPVKLFIAGIDTAVEHPAEKGSKWIATFRISCDSNKPIKYKLAINWNGEWYDREADMLNHSVEIKEIKK